MGQFAPFTHFKMSLDIFVMLTTQIRKVGQIAKIFT